jgi:hypothetical protein
MKIISSGAVYANAGPFPKCGVGVINNLGQKRREPDECAQVDLEKDERVQPVLAALAAASSFFSIVPPGLMEVA